MIRMTDKVFTVNTDRGDLSLSNTPMHNNKTETRKYAVIVAGGSGIRAGGDMPKQFQPLLGRPMLWWSMKAFKAEDSETQLIIVLHPGFFDDWDMLFNELPENERFGHEIVCGGRTRAESVANGLLAIPDASDALVAVHDAARPLLSAELIRRGWQACAESAAGAVPAVDGTDSLRMTTPEGSVSVKRSDYVAVQTPQVFPLEKLKACYAAADVLDPIFTDDASITEHSGMETVLYKGEHGNIKVTNPQDFSIAELLIRQRQETRTE